MVTLYVAANDGSHSNLHLDERTFLIFRCSGLARNIRKREGNLAKEICTYADGGPEYQGLAAASYLDEMLMNSTPKLSLRRPWSACRDCQFPY